MQSYSFFNESLNLSTQNSLSATNLVILYALRKQAVSI